MRWARAVGALTAATVTIAAIGAGIGLGPSSGGDAAYAGSKLTAAAPDLRTAGESRPPAVPPAPAPTPPSTRADAPSSDTSLPAASGKGRRVVFDAERQRVWLVAGGSGAKSRVTRTYLVSGSTEDNLEPGTYGVWSRSARATGIDDSGHMRWMVRFARGERAPIGFHDIPVHRGKRVQTPAQLGTALSHGCIRQSTRDAKALWRFARLGTAVVVTS